jgi:hypothetical protein
MAKHSTDPFYAWLDHERIRELVHGASALTPGERLVLVKGLVPGLVDALGLDRFNEFLDEIRAKAHRFQEASESDASSAERRAPGEALGGPIPTGHLHLDGHRDARREGGREAEREIEREAWDRYKGSGRQGEG